MITHVVPPHANKMFEQPMTATVYNVPRQGRHQMACPKVNESNAAPSRLTETTRIYIA